MKQYKKRNGKVIVTEVKIDDIKELEENRVLQDTYFSEFNDVDDYISIKAERLG